MMKQISPKEPSAQELASRRLSFDFALKTLGLPKGARVGVLDLHAGSRFVAVLSEQSMLIDDAVLVWMCRKGGCVATVGDVSHSLIEGRLLIVFANTACQLSSLTPDFEATMLVGRINTKAIYNSLAIAFPRVVATPVLTLNGQEVATLTSLFEYAKNSLRNPRNSHRTELDVSILRVMHDELSDMLLRRRFEHREQDSGEVVVERFRLMLSNSTFEHREVDYYASQFGLSPKRFSTIVKKFTGETPLTMIAQALVATAKRLLVYTDLSSGEIAERLHFASPSFFCRYFHRYTGLTPTEWRNTHTQS